MLALAIEYPLPYGRVSDSHRNDNTGALMWRYLKAAFFAGPTVPALGTLPVNVLAVIAAGVFGFVEPSLWLVGAGAEVGFLFLLATNSRFQKVVDGQALLSEGDQTEAKRRDLISQLPAPDRAKMAALEAQCIKAVEMSRTVQGDDFTADSNRDALKKLSWLYLKLLIARHYLLSLDVKTTAADLQAQIKLLEKDLAYDKVSPSIKDSKTATLAITRKRLENVARREQTLSELESDMQRIEAQVDLAVENAGMRGQPQAVGSNIELASYLLDPELFGTSGAAVQDLDQTFAASPVKQ